MLGATKGGGMWARVSTFAGSPVGLDESMRRANEEVLPGARETAGYAGVMALVDRASGNSVVVTLWKDEESLRASEEVAHGLREQAARIVGESIVSVDRYEVSLIELV
jgi:hypothetical protein